tara:strand:- start:2774 stop:3442 length:669 start_codon:yes stop_codon:yes gene_type:complete
VDYSKEHSARRGKRYVCRICKERYHLEQIEFQKRSKTIYKRVCFSGVCEDKAREEVAKKVLKQHRKAQKDKLKQSLGIKPKKQSQHPLQKSLNKIARLLDKNRPCLARPFEATNRKLEGGHIFGVGSFPALRYNIWNIHGQSHKSNHILGGESLLMLEGIERRYGSERLDMVIGLRQKYKVLKLSKDDKKEALKIANQIVRDLESGKEYTRDEINEQLNIYV